MIPILLFVLFFICLIPLLLSKKRTGRADMFSPAGMFCAGFAFSYFGKACMIFADMDYVTYPENYVPNDDVFTFALILAILGIASFLIGYYFRNRISVWVLPKIAIPGKSISVILSSIPVVLGLVSVIGLIGLNAKNLNYSPLLFVMSLRDSLMSSWNNYPAFFHFPVYSGLFLMVLLHVYQCKKSNHTESKKNANRTSVFGFVMVATCLIINITLGSRALTLSLILALVLYHHWYVRKIRFRNQIAFIIGVSILSSILGIVQKIDQPEGLKALSLPFPKNMLYRVSSSYEQFENLHAVVRLQPELQYGRTIVEDWFFTYIPRIVWADKPLDFGFVRAQKVLFEEYWDIGNRSTTYPIGMLAELYVNFGIFGIVIGMVMLGMLIRAVGIRARNYSTIYPAILTYIIATSVAPLRTYATYIMISFLGIFYAAVLSLVARSSVIRKGGYSLPDFGREVCKRCAGSAAE